MKGTYGFNNSFNFLSNGLNKTLKSSNQYLATGFEAMILSQVYLSIKMTAVKNGLKLLR